MYVVVAGAGEVGLQVAEALRGDGHDVVLVDPDRDRLDRAEKRMDVLTVQGSAASPKVLLDAGIARADVFFGVTSNDEVNLLACSLAKRHGPRTIARLNNLEYTSQPLTEEYRDLGVDVAVSPDLVAAIKIARLLDIPSILDMDVFAEGRVRVVESSVKRGAKVVGMRLRDLKLPDGALIVAMFREARILIPGGGDVLLPDDRVLLSVKDEAVLKELDQYFEARGAVRPDRPIKKVLVVGATRLGVHLSRLLQERGKTVTLIEEDRDLARRASEDLDHVTVVQGNATDADVLEEEGIESVDAVVGAAKLEEFNLLSCLLAKQYGVGKVVALINQSRLRPVAERIGIDLAVNPRSSVVAELLRHAHKAPIEGMALLKEGEAQVLALPVAEGSPIAGRDLKDAGLPKQAVVGAIVRGEEVIIPRGSSRIEAGDRLVVFTLTTVAAKLEKLF